MTQGELKLQEFCRRNSIAFSRVCESKEQTPDYELTINDVSIIAEVKDTPLMDSLVEISRDVFIDITTYPLDPKEIQFDRGLLQERHDYWEKARAAHQNQITQLKEKLEDRLRDILGINA
jgi:hypothetical protein